MMSGIELNELMTKVSNGTNSMATFEPITKPYNRELWRIDNGTLEEDLVNFVLSKSKNKIEKIGEIHRKISITLYKEDWIELVSKLKEKLTKIIDNNNKYEWASNIKITHQLCSQKYRIGFHNTVDLHCVMLNLKKVYIQAKMSSRKKFSYKEQFRQIEELHKIANEKYASYCDEKARHQQIQRENFVSFDNVSPLTYTLQNPLAPPAIINGNVANPGESTCLKIEVQESDDIEEVNSESSLTEISRSPIPVVFPEEAQIKGFESDSDVPFFVSQADSPADSNKKTPKLEQTELPKQQLTSIQKNLLQNLISLSHQQINRPILPKKQIPQQINLNIQPVPTEKPKVLEINQNIPSTSKDTGEQLGVTSKIESISENLINLSAESTSSFARISRLLEKQNEMLEQSNRLNLERLKLEQKRFELEKRRLELDFGSSPAHHSSEEIDKTADNE